MVLVSSDPVTDQCLLPHAHPLLGVVPRALLLARLLAPLTNLLATALVLAALLTMAAALVTMGATATPTEALLPLLGALATPETILRRALGMRSRLAATDVLELGDVTPHSHVEVNCVDERGEDEYLGWGSRSRKLMCECCLSISE